jgi:MinD-like ATPase involved in chromosome partitioning or flagellar assembly
MIFSFYSYKGGVGRTQLAVNLASYLCYYQRKKILLIDWDLEAPGLHFYFEGFENVQNKGIVELFTSFVDKMQEVELEAKEEELPQLDDSYIVKNVAKSSQHAGKIDLITAGLYDEGYKQYNRNVNAFNWKEFYDKLDGGNFIELLKKQLKALDYDYVFIDSRTGISDYSGIVNVQIPDVNVLVVAPTNQNFAGALRIAKNIKNSPYVKDGNRKPIIMPILSRVDLSIENRSNDWISKFQEKFGLFIKEFCESTNTREREFLNSTILDYKRDLSFGENKLFKDKFEEINDKTLAKQYLVIAKYIQILNQESIEENRLLIDDKKYLMELVDERKIPELFEELENRRDRYDYDRPLFARFKKQYSEPASQFFSNHDTLKVFITTIKLRSTDTQDNILENNTFDEVRTLILDSDKKRENIGEAIEILRNYLKENKEIEHYGFKVKSLLDLSEEFEELTEKVRNDINYSKEEFYKRRIKEIRNEVLNLLENLEPIT